MLDCDPLGTKIKLQCVSSQFVTFYWTQNVSEAGVNGTAILPGDTSHVTNNNSNFRDVCFTVSESTLGYYWCENSNAVDVSLRPSTITPVCPPMNSSKKCDEQHNFRHLHHSRTECAEENSPTVFSRPPLPTSCAGSFPLVSVITVIVEMASLEIHMYTVV